MRATLSRRDQQRLNCIRDSRTGHKFSSSRRAILLNTRVPPRALDESFDGPTQSSHALLLPPYLSWIGDLRDLFTAILWFLRSAKRILSLLSTILSTITLESNDSSVSRLERFVDSVFGGFGDFRILQLSGEIWNLDDRNLEKLAIAIFGLWGI